VVFEGTHSDSLIAASISNVLARLDAEWISAKKDQRDAKRRHKGQTDSSTAPPKRPTGTLGHLKEDDTIFASSAQSESEEPALAPSSGNEPPRESGAYHPEMDEMRCVLYAHGGMNLLSSFFIILKVKIKAAITLEVWTKRGLSSSSESYDLTETPHVSLRPKI
jgi:hypothetical protein